MEQKQRDIIAIIHLLACLLLLVQNLLISAPVIALLSIILALSTDELLPVLSILSFVDISGFLLLGLGYIIQSTRNTSEKTLYLAGGSCIIFWVVFRVLWQFIITTNLLEDVLGNVGSGSSMGILDNLGEPLEQIKYPFLIGSVTLGAGVLLIYSAKRDRINKLFAAYGLLNMVAVLMIAAPAVILPFVTELNIEIPFEVTFGFVIAPLFGLVAKILVVPLIGIITFFLMLLRGIIWKSKAGMGIPINGQQ